MAINRFDSVDLMLIGVVMFFCGLTMIWWFTPVTPDTPAVIMLPNVWWNLGMMVAGIVCYILGIIIALIGLALFSTGRNSDEEH